MLMFTLLGVRRNIMLMFTRKLDTALSSYAP